MDLAVVFDAGKLWFGAVPMRLVHLQIVRGNNEKLKIVVIAYVNKLIVAGKAINVNELGKHMDDSFSHKESWRIGILP